MLRKLFSNKSKTDLVMIQCRSLVNKNAVRRESIDGIEHIIVESRTLPDNVVMNGGLYPAEEVDKSFETLEMTLAPIEHPKINGEFISANDPRAINNFHVGAWNQNVRKEDGRIVIDKYINVQEAKKTERGKRLLDRINELETSESPRPIHTSVGVFLLVDELSQPKVNEQGDEYTWIAKDMVFDHDAILLDSVAAATPDKGVGIAVNEEGEKYQVQVLELNDEVLAQPVDTSTLSHEELKDELYKQLNQPPLNADYVDRVFDDQVIFMIGDQYFSAPYRLDNGTVTIVGLPLPVDRDVSFTPKTNSEGEAMMEIIINALKDAGVDITNMSDADQLSAYVKLQANQSDGDDNGATDDLAQVVANSVAAATKPLADQIASLQTKINAKDEEELNRLAELVGNSDKYQDIDIDAAKKLGVEVLRKMAANSQPSYGLSTIITNHSDGDQYKAPTDLPE